jgi:hypothetical protein
LDLLTLRLQSFLNTLNYNAIVIVHTFQSSVEHALGFSISTSCFLATDLNTETSTSNRYEVFLPCLVQSPWNLGTQLNSVYCPLLQLMTHRKRHLLSPINLRHEPIENMSSGRYPLLSDVTAYAKVCLPSRCPETGCITMLFCCCVRVLLSNCCSCDSAGLTLSKYATLLLLLLCRSVYYIRTAFLYVIFVGPNLIFSSPLHL